MSQEEYKKEYEKYKHVKIEPGLYHKNQIQFKVLNVDEENEKVLIETVKSGMIRERTLHWCRKNLQKV